MNIAILNWQDPDHPFAGGAEYHLWEYFYRMAPRHEIHWFGARARGMPRMERKADGITYHRLGPWHISNWVVPLLYFRWRKRIRPDVVVDSITKVPTFLPLWERSVPIVTFIPHLFGKTAFQETNPFLASYVYGMERLIPMVYKKTWFIAASESTREDLVRRGIPRDRITLFPPGVDTQRYVPGPKAPYPLVVYLGRIKRYKRVDLAIKAFACLTSFLPEARMVVVGGGGHLRSLQRMVDRMRLGDRIQFTGLVPFEEKRKWLQQAWILINTSPKEGWGMVNTEAAACGTPVVAFDAPGIRDSVRSGETGLLVPYGDIEGLCQSMARLLKDRNLREQMGRAARAFAETLSWDRFSKELETFLKEVVRSQLSTMTATESPHPPTS